MSLSLLCEPTYTITEVRIRCSHPVTYAFIRFSSPSHPPEVLGLRGRALNPFRRSLAPCLAEWMLRAKAPGESRGHHPAPGAPEPSPPSPLGCARFSRAPGEGRAGAIREQAAPAARARPAGERGAGPGRTCLTLAGNLLQG